MLLGTCNFPVDKILVKLAHRQALVTWKLVLHNFLPHNFIWNNKDTLFKNNSLFYHTWFSEEIAFARQLLLLTIGMSLTV